MTGIVIHGTGGPGGARPADERPVPPPGRGRDPGQGGRGRRQPPGRAAAAGRAIRRRPAPPTSPGLEIAGEVVAARPGVDALAVGDAVWPWCPGGGYAEYAVVHESNALPVPAGLAMVEAGGACPETYFTVWTNVFERGRLQAGRDASRPWRHLRHRHHGDPARQGLRRDGHRHGGQRREMRGLPAARRRPRDQLPRRGFRRGGQGGDRRHAAPT